MKLFNNQYNFFVGDSIGVTHGFPHITNYISFLNFQTRGETERLKNYPQP